MNGSFLFYDVWSSLEMIEMIDHLISWAGESPSKMTSSLLCLVWVGWLEERISWDC